MRKERKEGIPTVPKLAVRVECKYIKGLPHLPHNGWRLMQVSLVSRLSGEPGTIR
jgi:hypothetical protein